MGSINDSGQHAALLPDRRVEVLHKAPDRSAYVDVAADGSVCVLDAGEGTTPGDRDWLDKVLEGLKITHLPASELITEGPFALWRMWIINPPRS